MARVRVIVRAQVLRASACLGCWLGVVRVARPPVRLSVRRSVCLSVHPSGSEPAYVRRGAKTCSALVP
eukprot:12005666-Alexandrium_andersonii.AAC.1